MTIMSKLSKGKREGVYMNPDVVEVQLPPFEDFMGDEWGPLELDFLGVIITALYSIDVDAAAKVLVSMKKNGPELLRGLLSNGKYLRSRGYPGFVPAELAGDPQRRLLIDVVVAVVDVGIQGRCGDARELTREVLGHNLVRRHLPSSS